MKRTLRIERRNTAAKKPTKMKAGLCCLCFREVLLTFHHLIPRKLHRRPFYRRNYSKSELNNGIYVCRLCHNGIHSLYDEKTLAKQLNSYDALRADTALKKHCNWVAKQRVTVEL